MLFLFRRCAVYLWAFQALELLCVRVFSRCFKVFGVYGLAL